jgi:membrane protease YdiL (CAAX protease family)
MSASQPAGPSIHPRAPRTAIRVGAIAEIVLIIGLILLIIWIVTPLGRPGLDLWLQILAGVLLLGSSWFHGDSLDRLGLRFGRFSNALAGVLPVTLAAAGVAIAAGYFLKSLDPPENVARELAEYFAWAAAQQYALQSVILRRLEDAGLQRAAPLTAAAFFSLVHAPNPGLMVLTFLGGLLWCSTFRRHPSIAAVALSHAFLAVVIASSLPTQVIGGYRIGPAYLDAR